MSLLKSFRLLSNYQIRRFVSTDKYYAGRIAIVTGAGGGIGRQISKTLAKRGATVITCDINEELAQETRRILLNENHGKHMAFTCNVSKTSDVDYVFEGIEATFTQPANILVNCAGITRDGFMLDMKEKAFDDVIDVNLKGTFLMTQAACKYMVSKKVEWGSIVNISSISGKIGNMGQCNYSASKAAIESFTRVVSKEMSKHNIRCNAVMPGFIDTQLTKTVPPKIMNMMMNLVPMKRLGTTKEIADSIEFLISKKSSYITGVTLQVSGGLFM